MSRQQAADCRRRPRQRVASSRKVIALPQTKVASSTVVSRKPARNPALIFWHGPTLPAESSVRQISNFQNSPRLQTMPQPRTSMATSAKPGTGTRSRPVNSRGPAATRGWREKYRAVRRRAQGMYRPRGTQRSRGLTIHTWKYAPPLPVNVNGWASISWGSRLGIDSAPPRAGWGYIGLPPGWHTMYHLPVAGRSEPLPWQQVAPLPRWLPGQRHAADADAFDGLHRQAHGRTDGRNLPGPHALERKTQPGFVLPARADRRQPQAVQQQALAQALQAVGGDRAGHLHDAFLLRRVRLLRGLAQRHVLREILRKNARQAPILRVDHQTAGLGRQRRQAGKVQEVARQHARARGVFGQVPAGMQQRAGLRPVRWRGAAGGKACGFVQQQGDGAGVGQRGVLRHRHVLLRAHARAGGLHHLALHADAAVFYQLL